MSKQFLLILVGLALFFGGAIALSKNKNADVGDTGNGDGTNHRFGTGEVLLVEFGDFQCPFCATYLPIVQQIKIDYEDKITFQFRHYPLVNIHQNAMAAHRAAEAASRQGKFWEMHDILYARQKVWETSTNATQIFEDYATEIGVNIDTYKQDVASSAVNDAINADVKAAQALGLTSTPSFVLEGKVLEDVSPSYDTFKNLLDEAISAKSSQ